MTTDLRASLAAGDFGAVLALLSDLAFLEERCRDSIDTLLDDLGFVLRRAPTPLPADVSFAHASGARIDRDVIARIEAIIDGSRDELARDAAARLFPLLYNELFWFDAPERAAHQGGLATSIRQLWRWMESWRAIFEARPGRPWLRRLRPPTISRAAITRWRIEASVRSISPDGTRLLAMGEALNLVDARTGHIRATLNGSDGRFARTGDQFVVRAGTSVELWSGDPPTLDATLGPHAHAVEDVVFSLDGLEIITRAHNELRVFRVADGTCVATRKLRRAISRFLPCAGGVLVNDGDRWRHWDYARDQMSRKEMAGYADWTAVSPSGDRVVSIGTRQLRGWTIPDATPLFALEGNDSLVAFHPSGDSFATRDSGVFVRDATTGETRARIPSSEIASLTYDPTGRYLVFERSWGRSQVWDLTASRVAADFDVKSRAGSRVVFSHDGNVLALGIPGSSVVLDMTSLAPVVRWRDDEVRVDAYSNAYFSPSRETLVVRHDLAHLSFWDVERGVIRHQVEAREMTQFDRGARVLGRHDDVLIALSTEDGAELWRAVLHAGEYENVIAADAARLLLHTSSTTDRVIALGMDDGKGRYRLDGEIVKLVEGNLMVTRTKAGDVTVRSVDTGIEVVRLAALRGNSYALSPDGRWLAIDSGSDLDIWDLTTRTRAHTLKDSGGMSFSFRSDSAALHTWKWITQQSGNQDLLEEADYDVVTGGGIASSSTWENDVKIDASEVAPGVVLDGQQLRVDGVALVLPRDPIIGLRPGGAITVASVRGGHVELYALRRGN